MESREKLNYAHEVSLLPKIVVRRSLHRVHLRNHTDLNQYYHDNRNYGKRKPSGH